MLLETMTIDEVVKETFLDKDKIWESSTIYRLQEEYFKWRKTNKLKKDERGMKLFTVKTKRKNIFTLIIELNKNGETQTTIWTHYYTSKGIRVVSLSQRSVLIFNSHVFKRWNERLNKGIVQPLDIIRQFFMTNNELYFKVINHGDMHMFGIVDGGFMLGNYHSPKVTLVKTFINKELAGKSQIESEEQIKEFIKSDKLYEFVTSSKL